MKLDDKILNQLINYCIDFVDNNLKKYNYKSDITHLLYIIVPAFIVKYGFEHKNKIFKTFEEVPFIINNNAEKVLQAYYSSLPIIDNDKITTKKHIVLNYYEGKPLMELIDNIVHEYNHAVNSIINEIKWDDSYVYLRTGLMYVKYNKNDYFDNGKDDAYILEEIINTKQTEDIIDIINSFNNYNIENNIISNTLYNIDKYINNNYNSEAYLLQSTLCKELMNNRTLISVLSNMRFLGNVDDIPYFFDNITGIDDSYNKLVKLLNESVKLEQEFGKVKIFKKRMIRKILRIYSEAKDIVDTFNSNYHFK